MWGPLSRSQYYSVVAKRGEMDGATGTEFTNAAELNAAEVFAAKARRAFFVVVRYIVRYISVKALTAEKEAQLIRMLNGNDIDNVAQILAMDGPTLKEYTDMPGYWAKMVKDAAQA